MSSRTPRSLAFLASLLLLAPVAPLAAQTTSAAVRSLKPVAQANRISASANYSQRAMLANHLPGWMPMATQVASSFDLSQTMHLTVQLSRSAEAEAAVEKLIADQQNPSSPLFHQWVTPEQLGALYGPTDADVAAVTSWIESQGLHVDSISGARNLIEVSGPAARVANAFAVNFAQYQIGTAQRFSATSNPSIPAALASVVNSVRGLTEVHLGTHAHMTTVKNPRAQSGSGITPMTNLSGGAHAVLPNDFAVIYDVNSVYSGGNTGATIGGVAQHIAVVGRSRVSATDLSQWESLSGLSTSLAPVVYIAGTDPGTTADGDQGEATLDVERTIGTAPGAITDLVLAKDTNTVDGVYTAAAYSINTLRDKVLTLSFGLCESSAGVSDFNTYNALFQTGAASGISIFVSSGDSGADGCLSSGKTGVAASVTSANALCGPYVTCVGGTEFADTASPSTYWSSTQSAGSGYESALSYIPEGAWNEPSEATNTGTSYVVAATGGAPSNFASKPTWQTGTGVIADGKRDTPDVAFPAAVHDGYLACLSYATNVSDCSYIELFGGTSAAAPAMAGVAALLNTSTGSAQGLLNPLFYSLASSAPSAFHDVTVATSGVSGCTVTTASMCNNSTPGPNGLTGGAAGYLVGAGYDMATGLGSLDVAKFIAAANSTQFPASTTTLTVTPNSVLYGAAVTLKATVSPSTATGTVTFYSNSSVIASAVPVTAGVATTTYTTNATGTLNLTAAYSGDSNFGGSSGSASLVVTAPFTLSATAIPSFASGATTGNTGTVTVTPVGTFTGVVNLQCTAVATSGSPTTAASCSVNPTFVTGGGQATITVTSIKTTTQSQSGTATLAGFAGMMIAFAGLLIPGVRRRSLLASRALVVLALLGAGTVLSGCGNGTTPVSNPNKTTLTSAGQYILTITGSSATNSSVTASTTLSLTITQ